MAPLARQAALRGKRVAVLQQQLWGAQRCERGLGGGGAGGGPRAYTSATGGEALAVPPHLREPWAERVAIMVMDGGLPREEAERLAWNWLQAPGAAP